MPSGSQQMGIVWVGHNLFDHTNENEDPVIQFYQLPCEESPVFTNGV